MKHKILMTLICIGGISLAYVTTSDFQQDWNPFTWFIQGWISFFVLTMLTSGLGIWIYHTHEIYYPEQKNKQGKAK